MNKLASKYYINLHVDIRDKIGLSHAVPPYETFFRELSSCYYVPKTLTSMKNLRNSIFGHD